MRLQITGNAVVVTSKLTKELFDKANIYCKDALTVRDDKDNQLYKVEYGVNASISKYGITFNGKNAEGNLQATLLIEASENAIDTAKKVYGNSLAALAEFEDYIVDGIKENVADVDAAFASLEGAE